MKHAWARHVVVVSAALAYVLLVAVIVGATAIAWSDRVRDAGAAVARLAPRAYADARSRYATPAETLAAILPDLRAPGWQLRIAPPPGFEQPGPRGGPPAMRPGERPPAMGAVAAILGISPQRVPLIDAELSIVPDLDGYTRAALVEAGVVLLALFFGAAALWRLNETLRRGELEPLVQTTAALRRLAARDFAPRTIVTGVDGALGELARAYNEAAEQVAVAIRERDAVEGEKQRFLADAGHELRTPVTIMMGYLEILRGLVPEGGETADRVLTGMRTEMHRMRSLIEKLIVLSRLESTPHEPRDVDVVAVAAGVRESLAPLAGTRAIVLDAPPAAAIAGDENDLHEALSNLVENALKYAPESDVRITVRESDDCVTIEVADRGPGMDTVDQRRAFERFYRGAGRSGNEGSGLGLAIVKRAVERCGGTVSLTSARGSGTRFVLTLQRAHPAIVTA
jgi:two-component system OmpR family sensor kinase